MSDNLATFAERSDITSFAEYSALAPGSRAPNFFSSRADHPGGLGRADRSSKGSRADFFFLSAPITPAAWAAPTD